MGNILRVNTDWIKLSNSGTTENRKTSASVAFFKWRSREFGIAIFITVVFQDSNKATEKAILADSTAVNKEQHTANLALRFSGANIVDIYRQSGL